MASPALAPKPRTLLFTEEEISARAYEIFLRKGSIPGSDQENWFQAIEELTAEAQIEVDEPLDTTPMAAGRMPSRAMPRRRTIVA
jgi:hypothetical protein